MSALRPQGVAGPGGSCVIQDVPDLLQAQTELSVDDDAVQPFQIASGVEPISGGVIPTASRFRASWLAASNGFAAVKTIRAFSGVITSTSRVFHGVSRGPSVDFGRNARHAATSESVWLSTQAKLTLIAGGSSETFSDAGRSFVGIVTNAGIP